MIRSRLARLLRSLADRLDRPAVEKALDNLYGQAELRRSLIHEAADRLGVADELLADGSITSTQHARMVGKPELVAPRPTPFVRKRARWLR